MQLVVNKGNKTEKGKGVDNIPLKVLEQYDYEGRWDLPAEFLRQSEHAHATDPASRDG